MIAGSSGKRSERQTYRILLVGAESGIVERFRASLKAGANAGAYQLSTAESLRAAESRLLAEGCDLVVLDLAVAQSTVGDFLEHIERWSRTVSVIVLGERENEESAARALTRGAMEVVVKDSLDASLLGPLLRQAARARRMEKDLRGRIEEARSLIHRYQGILRNTPDGLCHLNAEWQILVTNHTMKRIFDPHLRLTEEVFGRPFGDLFASPQEFDRYRVQAEESIERTGADQQEVELRRWDGTRIFTRLALCYLDSVRPEMGYVATITDVTEHRKTRDTLEFQEGLEAITSSIGARFITLHSREMEGDFLPALGKIGEFLEADRCYLIHFQKDGVWPPSVFEWASPGMEPAFSTLSSESPEALGWSMERFQRGETAQVRSVVTLDSRLPEREFLLSRSVVSYLAIPLHYEGTLSGCLGFHAVRREKEWTEETVSQLQFLGLIFLNALKRGETLNALTRLSSVVEQTADSVLITDTEGTIEYVNPAFEAKTGFSREEAVGQNPRIIRSGKHDAAFYKGLWDQIRSGRPFRGVIINRRKSGELYHEAQTITPIRDEQGTIRHYVSTAKDITDQVAAEQNLRESERRYRGLVESQHDLIIRIDPKGRFTFLNDAYCREFSLSPADREKTDFFEFIHREDVGRTRDALKELSSPPHRVRVEHKSRTAQGYRWLEWEMYGIRDLRGRLAEIQAVGRDITEKKRLETEREVLHRLTHHFTLPVTLSRVARIIAFESRRLFSHDSMWFSLYDETHSTLSGIYLEDTDEGETEPKEVGFEKTVMVDRGLPLYTTRRPLLINRMEEVKNTDLLPFGHVNRISRSLMFAPILWEDRIIAVLSVQSYHPGRYTERDLRVLETLADQCGGVLARLRSEEERETLQRLSQQLTAVRSPHDLGEVLARESKILLGYDAFCFSLYDAARRRFTQVYLEDIPHESSEPREFPPETIELGEKENELYATGEPGLINDVDELEGLELHRFGNKSREPRSILYAPVSWNGRLIAVLSIQSYRPRRYTGRELHLLHAFADQCGGTLARVRAEGEREALQRLSDRLLGRMTMKELGKIVSEESRRVFHHDAFFLDLLTDSREMRVGVYFEDIPEGESEPKEFTGPLVCRLSESSRRVAAGESILINRDQPVFEEGLDAFGNEGRPSCSLMFAPVRREGEVVGVLSVQSYLPGRYTEEDLRLLEAFAAQCGAAVARVWAAEALAHESATLNHVIEYNPYAILLTDAEGRPVKANPAYLELFGAPPPDSYCLFADSSLEAQGLLDLVRQVQKGETVSVPDVWYVIPGEETNEVPRKICLRSAVFPIVNAQGVNENYVVMHQDVTARRQAEDERQELYEELIQKERLAAMGQTIAEVAHCMKNIFTAVNGGIYLLEQSLKVNRWDLTRRSYQTLRQSATRLYLFLMNMLDFSKKREGVKEEVSIRSILDDVIRMLQANADARNIAIGCRVDPDAEVLRLDSQGLFRTLLNLGLNAIDAMPKGGTLEFSAGIRRKAELLPLLQGADPGADEDLQDGKATATIEVIDTGAGIPQDVLNHIFEPFYSTKGSRGTGLGLSSARKFIHEQGGEIRVASEQGKGTRFQLVFPL